MVWEQESWGVSGKEGAWERGSVGGTHAPTQREAQQRHARDEDTRNDQVEEVVQGSPADVDSEGDVHIWFRAAVVCNRVFLARDAYSWNFNSAQDIKENCIGFLVIERTSY